MRDRSVQTTKLINWQGIAPTKSVEDEVVRSAERLGRAHPGAVLEQVTVEDRPGRRYERLRYNARLDIRGRAGVIVVNRESDDDVRAALGSAFAAAERELARHARC